MTDGPPEEGEGTRIMDWSRDGIYIWRVRSWKSQRRDNQAEPSDMKPASLAARIATPTF